MTTKMIKKPALILLLVCQTAIIIAQEKDFGIWYTIAAEKEIVKNLDLGVDFNLRTYHDAGEIDEGFFDLGLDYKINKTLGVAVSYRYTKAREDDEEYHTRHKWFADLKAKTTFGDLDLSGRVRFQQRHKTYFEDENDRESKEHIRLRLKASYDIPSFPLNPFLSSELFLPVFDHVTRTVDKQRFSGGFEYNISKKHAIELEYTFQRDFFPKETNMNIISVGYNIKL
ncbi:MAG TPA: DUF2490 domain-containing protein [Bacteroidales bacterium]|jgi:opacity protein-like surface antigen|nr:DUF2490 domain-containing protein [Bacteroidales bacterium]